MVTVEGWITAEDIKKGVPRLGNVCPLGRSLARETGRPTHASRYDVYFIKPDRPEPRGLLPDYLRNFVAKFDAGERVYPIRYRVSIPEASEEGIYR